MHSDSCVLLLLFLFVYLLSGSVTSNFLLAANINWAQIVMKHTFVVVNK